jgi:hypothetical protein
MRNFAGQSSSGQGEKHNRGYAKDDDSKPGCSPARSCYYSDQSPSCQGAIGGWERSGISAQSDEQKEPPNREVFLLSAGMHGVPLDDL